MPFLSSCFSCPFKQLLNHEMEKTKTTCPGIKQKTNPGLKGSVAFYTKTIYNNNATRTHPMN